MRKKYEDSYKKMIVELLQSGQSVKQVSSDYGLNGSMIRKWKKSYEQCSTFTQKKELSESDKRLKVLEKELREVRLERDILKKAVSIFSKSDK